MFWISIIYTQYNNIFQRYHLFQKIESLNIIFPISLFKLHLNIRIFHFFFINGVKFFIHGHGKMVLPVTNHPCGRKRQSGLEMTVLVNSAQSESKTQTWKTYKTQEQCTFRADHFNFTVSFKSEHGTFFYMKLNIINQDCFV